jgi:hypothetical protein
MPCLVVADCLASRCSGVCMDRQNTAQPAHDVQRQPVFVLCCPAVVQGRTVAVGCFTDRLLMMFAVQALLP